MRFIADFGSRRCLSACMLNKIEFNILYYSRRTDVWMGRRRLAQVLVGRLVELNEMDYASTRESREREQQQREGKENTSTY
jgi:hypothetical protein